MDNWDDIDQLSTDSSKCPHCGANIFFNELLGLLVCSFCGGVFTPESLEDSGSIATRDTGDADEREGNKQEFVCDSCGATVVTDYNTAATFCAFCGSPTLIKRRLSREFRPDVIIPFKISHEQAVAKYTEWLNSHRGVPSSFKKRATVDKITGFYIPFWLLDADCNTFINGAGRRRHETTVEHYFIDRTIKCHLTKVPFDGCKRISDSLMQAIEPYDFSDLVPYKDMYLPGFYAQRYDRSALDMVDTIGLRLNRYAEAVGKEFRAKEYEYQTISTKGSTASNFTQLYALLPVWFLNVKYKDQTYSIAVNGQTGEAGGNLPTDDLSFFVPAVRDSSKFVPVYIIFATLLAAMVGFACRISIGDFLHSFLISVGVLLAGGLMILMPLIVARYTDLKSSDHATLDSAPGVEQYLDYKSKIEIEGRDIFSHFSDYAEEEELASVMKMDL